MPLAITEFATREALMQATAERIAQALSGAVTTRGEGCAALSGGATPAPAYRALASMPLDWPNITLALVDERFVATSDEASNQRMIERTLAPVFSRGAKLAPMYFAAESVERAAERAETFYAPLHIDVALMGMGADGHTASWFPGSAQLRDALSPDTARTVMALKAPQAQGSAERLTLTRRAIARAGHIILLITGAEKRARLEQAVASGDTPVGALFAPDMPPVETLWAA